MTARKREDAKVAALREGRVLNSRPERVVDEAFVASEFFDARDLVQVKYEMVRRVLVDGAPVTGTAAAFGFSRPSYYDAAAALSAEGLPGLLPQRPGPKRAHKLGGEVVAFMLERLAEDASLRSRDLAPLLEARFGLRVHARSIERALARWRSKSGGR
jgi:transposase